MMPALAGISRMPYPVFLAFNALGGIAWGVGFALLGYFAGGAYQRIEKQVGTGAAIAVAVIVVAALVVWHVRRRRADRAEESAAERATEGTAPVQQPSATVPAAERPSGPAGPATADRAAGDCPAAPAEPSATQGPPAEQPTGAGPAVRAEKAVGPEPTAEQRDTQKPPPNSRPPGRGGGPTEQAARPEPPAELLAGADGRTRRRRSPGRAAAAAPLHSRLTSTPFAGLGPRVTATKATSPPGTAFSGVRACAGLRTGSRTR
ncbi:hypothetical protein ACFQZC_17055 [Streptacidiphilus monticola]